MSAEACGPSPYAVVVDVGLGALDVVLVDEGVTHRGS